MYIIGDNQQVVPVGEYKYIQAVSVSEYNEEINAMKKINLTNSTTIDLTEYLSKIIEINEINENNIEGYIKSNNTIKIDENKDFYITELSLTYNGEEKNKIMYLSIDGYVLQK